MKITDKMHALIKQHPRLSLLILVVFFLCTAWIADRPNEKVQTVNAPQEMDSLDTFIPSGFVLIPIQIQNLTSLDSIVGQYAIVDLYTEGESAPLGRGIKLIRSPRDPSQFAVLVPEAGSREVVKQSYKPLQVIVQKPDQSKSEIRASQTNQRISWEE